MNEPNEATATVDEGSRSFAVFVQAIDKGELHAELSDELRRVAIELSRQASNYQKKASGALTLTLDIAADPTGAFFVKGTVKAKVPQEKRPGTILFLTKGGNLSVENERQPRLPFREVPPVPGAREPQQPTQAARHV